MKSSPRTKVALGALLTMCVAAPVAQAEKPDHVRDHGNGQGHQAPEPAAAPAATCEHPAARQVFAQFRDRKNYVLTTDGGFEQGGAGWTLTDGATVVDGNEPFLLNDAADAKSLSLPAGSSATSPTTCFKHQDSTFRLVARTTGNRRSRLKVEVLYTSGKGKSSRVAGKLRGGDEWRPTKKLALAIGRAKARRSGKGGGGKAVGTVSFRFTPIGAGDWQIDDLFLDPRARR